MSRHTKLIQFNINGANYPKFEIYNETVMHNNIFTLDDIKIVTFIEITDDSLRQIINNIITIYKLTKDVKYVTECLDIPFSFLLINLNIYNPNYTINLVIQSFDQMTYYLNDNMEIYMHDDLVVGGGDDDNILKSGSIHSFMLDQKVLSMWKYDKTNTVNINYSPPINISPAEFLDYIVEEKTNTTIPNYGVFLLDIVKGVRCDTEGEILYNYNVKCAIQLCKFSLNEYITNHTLIKFYLLINPEGRFIQRDKIIEFMEKKLL